MRVDYNTSSHTPEVNKNRTTRSQKSGWKLTDTLKEQIIQYAREDAEKDVYMGDRFQSLRKNEVAKVAPNRAALIGKLNPAINMEDMKKIKEAEEADKRLMCILFGTPYKVKFQSVGFGSAAHVYNENGEEVLTYTGGVGWHEKETKAETEVHGALKFEYYSAWQEAKKAIKANGRELVSVDGEIAQESKFSCEA